MSDAPLPAPGPGTGHAHAPGNVFRTELFSDAVFAIAITLLALNLSVTSYRQNHLGTYLAHQWPTYAAFFVSFTFVAVMCMNHHAAFHSLSQVTFPLQWANMGVLLGATVLSFPTGILADAFVSGNQRDERAAVVLYGLVALVMGLSWTVFFWTIYRHPDTWKHEDDGPMWRRVSIWATFGALFYLVAIAAGLLTTPVVSLASFLVLVLYRSTQARRINHFRGHLPHPDHQGGPAVPNEPGVP